MKSDNKNDTIGTNIETLFEKLEKFVKSKTVVGEEIQIGDVRIIPIVSATFGLGSGGGKDDKNNADGGGAGVGAKIMPTALLIIKDGNVELLPINKSSGFEKLVDKVPEILAQISKKDNDSKKELEKD